MMDKNNNPNHRNSTSVKEVKIEEPIAEVIEEVTEENTLEKDEVTMEYLYSLNKKEQVELLKEIGYKAKDIKKLKKEKDRVDEIFKHVGVE